MDGLWLTVVGAVACLVVRSCTIRRLFTKVDDMLLGALGSLLGGSLGDMLGLFRFGEPGDLLLGFCSAVAMFTITAIIWEQDQRSQNVGLPKAHVTHWDVKRVPEHQVT